MKGEVGIVAAGTVTECGRALESSMKIGDRVRVIGIHRNLRESTRSSKCRPQFAVYSRSVTTEERKLLVDVFPALASELRNLLADQGESALADQVQGLTVVERCRCSDDFCGMFYVLPKPDGAYGPDHRNVALTPKEGMLILDVVADRIAAVEVLYRDEVRRRLLVEFP